jgi:proteic killer suppression protein
VIKGYKNAETRLIAERGKVTKRVLRILPRELHDKARIKLAALDAAENLEVLRAYPGLDLKTFAGMYQMRINDTYRIRFTWDGKDADNVEIGDFHT